MAGEGPRAATRPGIPGLHEAVIGAGDHSQAVAFDRPDAFHVAPLVADDATSGAVPEFQGSVQSTGKNVPSWQWTIRVVNKPRPVGGTKLKVGCLANNWRGALSTSHRHGLSRVLERSGRILIWLEIIGHGKNLLHVADVAHELSDHLAGVQVPEHDRAIIRGREQGPADHVNFDVVDPVLVVFQTERNTGLEVVHPDGMVNAATGDHFVLEVYRDDTISVRREGAEQLSRAPVPKLDSTIQTRTYELLLVHLKRADAASMSLQRSNFLSGLEIPDLDGVVVGARSESGVIPNLKAGDTVGVAFERLEGIAHKFPVDTNLPPVPVHVLPRSLLFHSLFRRADS